MQKDGGESRPMVAGIFPSSYRLIRKNLSLPAREQRSLLAHLHNEKSLIYKAFFIVEMAGIEPACKGKSYRNLHV